MNIYEIEVLAIGTYTKIDFNDRSGCSDVDRECYQEGTFDVAAESLVDALALVVRDYEKCNRDWTNSADTFYYDPISVTEREDDGDGGAEILDYHLREPRLGADCDAPMRYSREVEL